PARDRRRARLRAPASGGSRGAGRPARGRAGTGVHHEHRPVLAVQLRERLRGNWHRFGIPSPRPRAAASRTARHLRRPIPSAGRLRMSRSTVAIIPARYGSTRLPGKALADIAGRPMVWHVAERTRRARGIARVIVATDDLRIRDAVAEPGVDVALPGADPGAGPVGWAGGAGALDGGVLITVRGDLPLLDPLMIEALAARMADDPALPMATLAVPVHDDGEWRSPQVVKVVASADHRALYFSRSPVPFDRDGMRAPGEPLGWRHVGMYAYRRDVLLRLAAVPPAPLPGRAQLA